MSKQSNWTQLRDGATLHAEQLLQLADDTFASAAGVAAGVGAAGKFVVPSSNGREVVNRIELDHEGRSLVLDNVRVLTSGGFCASVPPPQKEFVLPPSGLPCLNLYVRPYLTAAGVTDAVWEAQPATQARGVCLVRWTDERFVVVPEPYSIGSLDALRLLFEELVAAGSSLYQMLINGPPTAAARLGLLPPERSELAALGVHIERLLDMAPSTPLAVARPSLLQLGRELYGWFCFAAARRSGRDATGLTADLLSRRALLVRGNLPVPDYAQGLVMRPSDGSMWIQFVETLLRSTVGFTRVLQGEKDEDTVQPIETFEPDLWPDGLGLRYALPDAAQLKIRCDLSHPVEPLLLWGLGVRTEVPHLRSTPLDPLQPGRYEAHIGPISVPPGQDLVLVVDSSEVVVSVSLSR